MRAVVVYESMYGNTHAIADHIATGLRDRFDTSVVSVDAATADVLVDADLIVVGGPTHVHGMSSATSRRGAAEAAEKDDDLELDPVTQRAIWPTSVELVLGPPPLELAGRDIYVREGCYLCHSQMIRPFRDEVERYGHYSLAAESMYDHPFQWGSKRTGPDLARVGGGGDHAQP